MISFRVTLLSSKTQEGEGFGKIRRRWEAGKEQDREQAIHTSRERFKRRQQGA